MEFMLSPQASAKLALLLIKEASKRGNLKLRYSKVYRTMNYWLGTQFADYVVERLRSGGFIDLKDGRITVLKPVKSDESVESLALAARSVIMA